MLGVVFIIEGRFVPVDVDVDVGNKDLVGNDTSEVEADVATFGDWVWGVASVVSVKGEDSSVIIALSVFNNTGGTEWGVFVGHKLFDEAISSVVLWVEEWDLDTGFENAHLCCFLSFLIKNYNLKTSTPL